MRRITFVLVPILAVACSRAPTETAPFAQLTTGDVGGTWAYDATYQGTPALTGHLTITTQGDSLQGSWEIRSIDPAFPFSGGCVTGVGTLVGRTSGDTLWVDMNPGWADCNVTLLVIAHPDGTLRGQWDLVGFAGPMAQGDVAMRRPLFGND